MRYLVWLLRLGFGAWLVPAGLNHFYPLFYQPLGDQPESTALITALIDTDLFALVKAVELFAGICLVTGWRVPLALVMLMPVSFSVWYWDVPLQGWSSISAWYGWAVLGANVLLALAWYRSYLPMLAPRSKMRLPEWLRGNARGANGDNWIARILPAARLIFGIWMLLFGLSHFVADFLPAPAGTTPMAIQLMDALVLSRLLDVAMAIQLAAGLLVLLGLFMPLALAVVLPVNLCALYWALVLERDPLWALLAAVALCLGGLLMLAHMHCYRAMLARRPLAIGEGKGAGMRYESFYANPAGRTPPAMFAMALLPLAVAGAFYHFLVPGVLAYHCLLMLLVPLAILVLRLLQHYLADPASPG